MKTFILIVHREHEKCSPAVSCKMKLEKISTSEDDLVKKRKHSMVFAFPLI